VKTFAGASNSFFQADATHQTKEKSSCQESKSLPVQDDSALQQKQKTKTSRVMTKAQLFRFIERTAWDESYWSRMDKRALELKSDGCTGVPDTFLYSCKEHDIHTRTHCTVYGEQITFDQAAYCIRRRVQQGSSLGLLSPISWLRWFGVAALFRWKAQEAWEEGPTKYLRAISSEKKRSE